MATVTLECVNKVYCSDAAQVAAVRDVSLAIADREFIVLVGPSGCGKSTTLRMVAGLEDVTSGMIRIAGRVMNNVAPKDRDIAMVFQNYALYPHMTVYKNMAFGLRMRRFPKAEIRRRVDQAAELLGIGHLLDRKPKQLSGGERQRVAVGRAIVREPRAFLFDEPLSNLDAKLRIQMRGELKKLHRRLRTTVIYVTHDQEEAMTLGDRIVVMKSGVVHQCDTPLEVYEHPRDRFVASFVGTPPMNFFEGRVQVGDGEVLLETGSGVVRLPQRLGERLAGRRGEPFVLGVRPEGLSFFRDDDGAGSAEACGNQWRMGVAVVEPLGSEKDVHLQACDGAQAVARVPSHVAVAEGNDVDVFLDASRMHVFEPGEAGLNIGLNGYGAQCSVH